MKTRLINNKYYRIGIDIVIQATLFALIFLQGKLEYSNALLLFLIINLVIAAVIRIVLKIYSDVSQTTGVYLMVYIGISSFLNYVVLAAIGFIFFRSNDSIMYYCDPLWLLFLIMTETFLLVLYRYRKRIINVIFSKKKQTKGPNTLIIGAGEAGKIVLDEVENNPRVINKIVGFVDDDEYKKGKMFHGYKILGTHLELDKLIEEYQIKEVIIAIANISRKSVREIIDTAVRHNAIIKQLSILSNGPVSARSIKELSIEELLGRESIFFDTNEIKELIKDKVVLVTGAGGSIGSELCRQIYIFHPKKIILFDIYENSTYDIQLELLSRNKGNVNAVEIITLIGSTYNESRVDNIFAKYEPDLVFHAAAYKHVPLMEENPMEAIRTNVIGTFNIANAAHKYKAQKMVLVSTDKAVRPTNVMGATKRFAETIIQYFSSISDTSFSAVRFGNVLGSNGSVVPLFRKQIMEGKSITVTHPDINRFFMTIPEAVSLILQSGVYADKGEIFILDMGEPIKIVDLAKKMIVQAGLKVDEDIKIEFTGLRPGEKLYEELLLDVSIHKKTPNNKIYIEEKNGLYPIIDEIKVISKIMEQDDIKKIKKELASIVTSYTPEK